MSPLAPSPSFEPEKVARMVEEVFGISGHAVALPSERDQNVLIRTNSGEAYVCKIAAATEERTTLEMQNRAMEHVATTADLCPRLVATADGDEILIVESPRGKRHFMRLLTHLPGTPMGQLQRRPIELFTDLGEVLGTIDSALADFEHPAAHRAFHWDLAQGLETVDRYRDMITDPDIRRFIGSCADLYRETVVPRLAQLRRSVIHGDANDHNVIVADSNELRNRYREVRGIIDFGDMVYSFTVADAAVAAAYAMLDSANPVAVAQEVVRGYNRTCPLSETELAVVFPLATMRLCMSVCLAAEQQRQRPNDRYLSISQEPIRRTLPRLAEIPPPLAETAFRAACGLAPRPEGANVASWLRCQGPASVIDGDLLSERMTILDLGVTSPLLHGNTEENLEARLTSRICAVLDKAGASVGIGQYDEARLLYTAPPFAAQHGTPTEGRTVHLGLDIFAEPGTRVIAPLAGTVFLVGINSGGHDYGPVAVLKHTCATGETFYTLYGHLDPAVATTLKPGQYIARGEAFAAIGTAEVNGGWTPHVHFQVILDLLGLGLRFPGVCAYAERGVWCALSPDPNQLLQIPADRLPQPPRDVAETLAARRRHMAGNLALGYSTPVKIERGWMQYLYDHTGRRFLDAYNNVPHVGHCHPRVVAAACDTMAVLNTNTRYLHDTVNDFAQRLAATMPDPLGVCFLLNSGSEANELALRLARTYTGHRDMIVLDGAYHGHTTSLIDISPYKHAGPGGQGAPSWVHAAPVADTYRGSYRADDPDAAARYALEVCRIIEVIRARGAGLCAFIAESCPSVAGQIIFPDHYLELVYRAVREAGGLCIADEVQTAYGRTGSHFYAFEAQGVVPDIVVLGKPIGNGHPIGAVVTTPEIAAAFDNGMEFFSTFGGNTVSCAVGRAVLDVVLEEGLQFHAARVGSSLLERLRELHSRFSIVGDVRGAGLFLGVELVRDRRTLEPATEEASFVADRMREEGVLLGTDGPWHNVVKIRPPMPFDEENAALLVRTLATILETDLDG